MEIALQSEQHINSNTISSIFSNASLGNLLLRLLRLLRLLWLLRLLRLLLR
jgi:hypothetical protein